MDEVQLVLVSDLGDEGALLRGERVGDSAVG